MRLVATVLIGLFCTALLVISGLQFVSKAFDLFTRGQLVLVAKDDEEEPVVLSWPADRVKIIKHMLGYIPLAVVLVAVMIYSIS